MQHHGFQYRINEKIKPGELEFSMDKIKDEIVVAQDWENHRTNVDTAKKIACKQLMDYGGFHQMVQGADLKPTPSNEITKLFDMADKKGPDDFHNYCFTEDKKDLNSDYQNMKEKKKEEDLRVKEVMKVDFIQNQREFKKTMDEYYPEKKATKENLQIFIGILEAKLSDENLPKIFAYDFDINMITRLISALNQSLTQEEEDLLTNEEYLWSVSFLKKVSELKNFKVNVKGMMKKAEKHLIKHFLAKLVKKEIIEETVADSITQKYQ